MYPARTGNSDERLFREAVRSAVDAALFGLRKAGCRRIGLFLSGGLDSSTLAYFAGSGVTAVTVGDSLEHPDVVHATLVARHLGLKHSVCVPPLRARWHAALVLGRERPACAAGDVAVFIACTFARQVGLDGVLAGDGADELLGGYWQHVRDPSPETFRRLWSRLPEDHLRPLMLSARAAGIRIRLPYLYRAVREAVAGVPLDALIEPGVGGKLVLRRAMRGRLPDAVINRRKWGFSDALG